jgi:hypothetical protein
MEIAEQRSASIPERINALPPPHPRSAAASRSPRHQRAVDRLYSRLRFSSRPIRNSLSYLMKYCWHNEC